MISRTTRSFWRLFDDLPPDVKRGAAHAYTLWRTNPAHRGLRFKCVNERSRVYPVRLGPHWRALAYRGEGQDGETLTWFWIGSHAEYDRLVRS